jgi:hypothetical protein
LLDPDGNLLSFVDMKKAQWYLNKGLGELVAEDPYTIKLNFQPEGRTCEGDENWDDDKYYATATENQCVVCGGKQNFLKFHVVPSLYRSHFPDSMKSHRSHDVLLMCFECHNVAQRYQEDVKHKLES